MSSDRLIIGRSLGFARHAPRESHALAVGVPGKGKTTALVIPNVLAFNGPALATSSKADVLKTCAGPRLKRGRVWCLDLRAREYALPVGVERVQWSPLRGCADWNIARRRAEAMCKATKAGDDTKGDYWATRGTNVLAPCFHAAAVGGLPLSKCLAWLRTSNLEAPRAILEKYGAHEAADMLREVGSSGREHLGSVIGTAVAATNALSARLLDEADADTFDPAAFFDGDANTLIAIAPQDVATDTGCVLAALTDEIYDDLKHRAESGQPVTRHVLFAIDEAGACPLRSLPGILAEGRSFGLRCLLATQSWAQIKQRFGSAGADTIRDATRTTVVFGGVTDTDLLESLSKISGQVWRRHRGSTDTVQGSWQPKHSAAGIHRLRQGAILAFTGGSPREMSAATYWKLFGIRELAATPEQRRRDRLMRVALTVTIVASVIVLLMARLA